MDSGFQSNNHRSGTETTPLLPDNHFNNQHIFGQHSKLRRFIKFLLILIPLILIYSYFYTHKKSDEKPSPPPFEDIKNPNEHHLIWKGAQSFDYYLESSNPMIFSNVIKELGSNFEKQNSKSIPKIEFIAKSDLGSPLKKERVTKKRLDKLRERIERGEENEFYEGVELYYDIFINFYESFKVLSATSGVNGEWKNSNITLISQENSTLVEVCEFKIDWSDDLEGVISKRNANNETSLNGEYNVVAYVKGSIDYGFMFYEKEDGGGKLFAETNQTEIGWKMDRR